MKKLEGRVALVTGGSRGIGRSIAVRLASEGARVFVNYTRGLEAAEETVRLCNAVGVQAEALGFDVADSAAVDQAIDQIKAKAGKLDILVNNAGIAHDGLLLRMKDEEWQRVIATNLSGAFYCARAASKLMIKGRYGRIIAISSVVGEMGNAGQVPYVSSKAGLIGMTKAMARELASRNITSNAVAPGFIETDMTNNLDDALKAEHFKTIPLARYGQPEDIAAAVSFLASEEAGYITGHVLSVNGGMYM
jgi:3-oxoacyl-[acyl-carrier protein] reductase